MNSLVLNMSFAIGISTIQLKKKPLAMKKTAPCPWFPVDFPLSQSNDHPMIQKTPASVPSDHLMSQVPKKSFRQFSDLQRVFQEIQVPRCEKPKGCSVRFVTSFTRKEPNSYCSWLWINTYFHTIFRGLFTSILTQLFWCELQGFNVVLTHPQLCSPT